MNSKQNLSGILLLDKPTGISSNRALQITKRLFNAAKAGHTGSLDPLASGLLPICFGEATKFSQYLLDANKEYIVSAKLGVCTDTGDSDGEVIGTKDPSKITRAILEEALEGFKGKIKQIPPMYSALKHQGQPLYKLARQGIEIERKARAVEIFHIELIEFKQDIVSLRVACSKGTYIRSIITDLGDLLECGAHVIMLRRTSVGAFVNMPSYKISSLEEKLQLQGPECLSSLLLPVDSGMKDVPVLNCGDDSKHRLQRGQCFMISQDDILGSDLICGMVKLIDKLGNFFGIGEIKPGGLVVSKRLLSTN